METETIQGETIQGNRCNCNACCFCLDIQVGDIVERRGDDGRIYEYEVSEITEHGQTMYIGADNAVPEFEYIMADDCIVKIRNNR